MRSVPDPCEGAGTQTKALSPPPQSGEASTFIERSTVVLDAFILITVVTTHDQPVYSQASTGIKK